MSAIRMATTPLGASNFIASPYTAGRIAAAENVSTINGIASAAAKAHKAGQLTDEQLGRMKDAVTKKRALVAQSAPAASSSDLDDGCERQLGEEG